MPDTYSTATLLAVLDGLDRPQTFLLDTFFPELALFDTEEVMIDKLDRASGLAPFVSPDAPGVVGKERGYVTQVITPAYLKPKNEVKPGEVIKRRPGERFGGDRSPAARRDELIAERLEDQRRRILRRKEWMASSVLRTGALTMVGENMPSTTVSFGRHASLTKALLTTARWGETGVEPLDDIETWAGEAAALSGAMPTTVVLDPKAWGLARKSSRVEKLLDFRYQAPFELQAGPLARGQDRWATYVGSVGSFDFWVYSQPYTADDGNPANFMPDHTVILAAPGVETGVAGYQAHGFIRDPRADYAPVEIFPKNWIEEDPAKEWIMSQSAPLIVPGRPNASVCVTVR